MRRYFLPDHVYFCGRSDAYVFLDLKRDTYTLVEGPAAAALRRLSSGAPGEFFDELNELVDCGLLTTDTNRGHPLVPTRVQLALEPLIDAECLVDARVKTVHIRQFVIACLVAAFRLRWTSIECIVRSIRHRKSMSTPFGPTNLAKARELTAVFHRMRSFFPRDYLCLYDSLALIEFLSRNDIFPSWVFGVKLEPWSAHCWIQSGHFTFNEDVEEAAGYTPVMLV